MRIIALIEDNEVIKKIIKHLGLWEIQQRPSPNATGPPKAPEHLLHKLREILDKNRLAVRHSNEFI